MVPLTGDTPILCPEVSAMMASLINRKQLKAETKVMLQSAQVSPKAMTTLYLGITLALNLLSLFSGDSGILSVFVSVLISLMSLVLAGGFVLYCMAIRRGERAEFLTLFDGFSFAGKLIALHFVMSLFIILWSMLFVVPGIVAAYRYRFAQYNLFENPGIGAMEALDMSKKQTLGYKSQLLMLDLSYFGWALLASLPSGFETFRASYETMQYSGSFTGAEVINSFLLPVWGWLLIAGVWSLFISLFYLPNFQCVELGYFEIAKSTSGVGAAAQKDSWSDSDSY